MQVDPLIHFFIKPGYGKKDIRPYFEQIFLDGLHVLGKIDCRTQSQLQMIIRSPPHDMAEREKTQAFHPNFSFQKFLRKRRADQNIRLGLKVGLA